MSWTPVALSRGYSAILVGHFARSLHKTFAETVHTNVKLLGRKIPFLVYVIWVERRLPPLGAAGLLACQPARQPACQPASLPACQPASLLWFIIVHCYIYQSCISKGIWRQGIGSVVRNLVSTLCPVVTCLYLCTPEFIRYDIVWIYGICCKPPIRYCVSSLYMFIQYYHILYYYIILLPARQPGQPPEVDYCTRVCAMHDQHL